MKESNLRPVDLESSALPLDKGADWMKQKWVFNSNFWVVSSSSFDIKFEIEMDFDFEFELNLEIRVLSIIFEFFWVNSSLYK